MMNSSPTKVRTALVTGGNRGIGLGAARALAADGVHVVVGSRSGEGPEGFDVVRMDVADTASVNDGFSAAEEILGSPVEILVANAGITRDQLLLRLSDEEVEDVIQTNLVGAIRCARRASRGMIRLKRGRMIFVSSVVGLNGSPGQVNYAASKAGLVGAARSITRELGGRGITANVVSPGFIDTDMTAALPQDLRATYTASVPAGRMGTVDDVAAACVFLASDAAAYVSGAVLPVDGGLGMGH
ncbi:SDR family oxidoreductase [Austwickia chelonae]|uniref:SDR family oxidoreductase n=1 Tax=Austwickia chelonae TaxID=100225 RepID=UPI000E2603F6|nr:SDR family oxidoreductase [Austwickia chelonae]